VHDSRGIEIVNFTISLALSAGTLMASAGTPYRLVPAHLYPWRTSCCRTDSERPHRCCHLPNNFGLAMRPRTFLYGVRMTLSGSLSHSQKIPAPTPDSLALAQSRSSKVSPPKATSCARATPYCFRSPTLHWRTPREPAYRAPGGAARTRRI